MGPGRIELPTLRLSGARSNQLSYGPKELGDAHEGLRYNVIKTARALIFFNQNHPAGWAPKYQRGRSNTAHEITRSRAQVNNYFARKGARAIERKTILGVLIIARELAEIIAIAPEASKHIDRSLAPITPS